MRNLSPPLWRLYLDRCWRWLVVTEVIGLLAQWIHARSFSAMPQWPTAFPTWAVTQFGALFAAAALSLVVVFPARKAKFKFVTPIFLLMVTVMSPLIGMPTVVGSLVFAVVVFELVSFV
jgi:ammonia channel protein AmtB